VTILEDYPGPPNFAESERYVRGHMTLAEQRLFFGGSIRILDAHPPVPQPPRPPRMRLRRHTYCAPGVLGLVSQVPQVPS